MNTRSVRSFAFFSAALLGLAPDSAAQQSLTQAPLQMAARRPTWLLEPGLDFFQAEGQLHLALPADFFAPGSAPIFFDLDLVGLPLETAGAFELGTTDTVLRRLSQIEVGFPSQSEAVVQMVELNLVGLQPIQVQINGQPELWDVRVVLDGPPQTGALQLDLVGPSTGTFGCELPIAPLVLFTHPGFGEIPLPLPPDVLQGTNGFLLPPSNCGVDLMLQHVAPTLGCGEILLNSPPLDVHLFPAQPAPFPPAFIDPAAIIDPQVGLIARDAVIGAGAQVHVGAMVGPGTIVGPNAVVGPFAVLGAQCVLDANVVVEAGAIVGDFVQMQPGSFLGAEAVLEDQSSLGAGALIGAGSRVGTGSVVGAGAQVGNGVDGGRGLTLGEFALIDDALVLTDGALVLPGFHQSQSILPCHTSSGDVPTTAENCDGATRAILRASGVENVATLGKEVQPFDKDNLPSELDDLVEDVDDAEIAQPKNGGNGKPYSDDYDCDDFAHDLEVALEVNYDATFTAIWEVNKSKWFWETWKPDLINGHALVDIHHNGRLIWIEAQFTGANGVGVNLDLDGDGKVGYAKSHGTTATEASADGSKCYRIEVYGSRAEAAKAGVPID